MRLQLLFFLLLFLLLKTLACSAKANLFLSDTIPIKQLFTTDTVFGDSDDPAIWINRKDLKKSLILGTDKSDENGGVFVYNLSGKIDSTKIKLGLKRVNNIDIAYDFNLGTKKIDLAVATERGTNQIRIFELPGMHEIDNGGIPVFEDENNKEPMGIALYSRAADHTMFVIVGRKTGPAKNYLYQYQLKDAGNGTIKAVLVRKFGEYSGKKEIESIAVDNENGYVYYSDEQFGIRKYYADPEKGNMELAVFGKGEFSEDNEGISIYKFKDGTGYILVSDQSANRFNVYPREGSKLNKHDHKKITSILLNTSHSDGSDITSVSLPNYKGGLFIAMSDDKTYQLYRWVDIAKTVGLHINKN